MSEEAVWIRASGRRLSGLFAAGGAGAAVIAAPHPLMGGRMDNPVVDALAAGLARAGHATLRFDYGGIGRSEGTPSAELAQADEDYAAALAHASAAAPGPCLAAGYSFGAGAALRAAATAGVDAERLILVALPAVLGDDALLASVAVPVALIVGDDDSFCPLSVARAWAERHPHLALHVVDDCDHFFSGSALAELPDVIDAAARSLPSTDRL